MGELILAKAKALFCSYGIKSVSMDDLAKVAGISKKTIYQCYSDKNELVNKIVEDLVQSHTELFAAWLGKGSDAVEEVLFKAKATFDTWAKVNQSFFYELEKSFPQAWKKLEKHKQKVLLPGIIHNLERGKKESLYRSQLNVAFMAQVRIQQLTGIFQANHFTSRGISVSQAMNELTSFYLHGITTEKGKKLLHRYLNN